MIIKVLNYNRNSMAEVDTAIAVRDCARYIQDETDGAPYDALIEAGIKPNQIKEYNESDGSYLGVNFALLSKDQCDHLRDEKVRLKRKRRGA